MNSHPPTDTATPYLDPGGAVEGQEVLQEVMVRLWLRAERRGQSWRRGQVGGVRVGEGDGRWEGSELERGTEDGSKCTSNGRMAHCQI